MVFTIIFCLPLGLHLVFCCGIPFYADPQSMYYSIPQFIFLIFNPISSVKIIFLVLSLTSYVGMFFMARSNFKFGSYVSLLCASLFLFNGFFLFIGQS